MRVERHDHLFLFSFTEPESVELSFDESSQCLTFSIDVGRPDDEHRVQTHEMLLAYSFPHSSTGGISMAVDVGNGHVIQMFRRPVGQLQINALCAALVNFAGKSKLWRKVIEQGGVGTHSPE